MTARFPRFGAITLALAALLIGVNAWGLWQRTASRDDFLAEEEQFRACERLTAQISRLRTAPTQVDESARTGDALAKLVESAASPIGLGVDRIVHVAPGESRRLSDSAYLEQATAVEFREVTLRQLIEFLLGLQQAAPGLEATHLSIRVPPSAGNSKEGRELWNVQLVLTSHIYAPKMTSPP
jgi:hypothetical protein